MACRNPCRLYTHLAFTYSVGPSSVAWSELGPGPPFPPMRVLEVQGSRALSPVCEVALESCVGETKMPGGVRCVYLHVMKISELLRKTIFGDFNVVTRVYVKPNAFICSGLPRWTLFHGSRSLLFLLRNDVHSNGIQWEYLSHYEKFWALSKDSL